MSEYGEGGYVPPEEQQQAEQQKEMNARLDIEYAEVVKRGSRIRKLKTFLLLLGTIGGISVGAARYPGEGQKEYQEIEAKEKAELDRYNEYLEGLKNSFENIDQAINEESLNASEKKIAKNEAVTVFLLDVENSAKLKEMMDLALDGGDPKISAGKLYRTLSEAGAQDSFYDHLRKEGRYQEFISPDGSMEKSTIYNDLKEHHFSTLAKNFLPTSGEISDEEIDPRLFAKGVEEIAKDILDNPEWSGEEKIVEFKKVLDDKSVREVLESSDFETNLAQSYSLIRISIDRKDNGDERSNTEIIKDLIEKQEAISDVSILSKDTENFIFVAGHDTRLNDDISRNAPRYEQMGKDFDVKNTIGFSEADGMKEPFKKAVAESKGLTTLMIDAHSNEVLFQLNNKENITVQEFAKVLLERVKAGESLDNVNIILGGCESSGLAENLTKELGRQAKKDKKLKKIEIVYPNIITAGYARVEQSAFRDAFSETAKGIQSVEGFESLTLTFRDIIEIMAPKARGRGAVTSVFVGGKGGAERVS